MLFYGLPADFRTLQLFRYVEVIGGRVIFGAHVSIAGGLSRAIDRGAALGAQCLQIFVSSPRTWQAPQPNPTEIARFVIRRQEQGMPPVFVHSIYLINLCSADDTLRGRSIESLALALSYAKHLNLDGVVTHLGSRGGRTDDEAEETLITSLAEALDRASSPVPLLLETAAGSTMGSTIGQLGRIIRRLNGHARLGICLDTAHVFASGYDVRNQDGLDQMLEEIDREVGIDRLRVVHANDSKSALGSGVDRHQNIGRGQIGEDGFALILSQPALQHLPFILEVPGATGEGPDAENLAMLRRLAGRA